MPLDFYDINDVRLNKKLFGIEHADFEILGPVLFGFKKVTGVTIDPYGTTRIYASHIKLVVSLIEEYLLNLKDGKQELQETLSNLVAHFENVKDGFIIIGD